MSKFVIRPVPSGVKFDLHSANGQRIATSETYRTKAACLKGIATLVNGFAPQGTSTTQLQSNTDAILRRCYGAQLRLLKIYESRIADVEYGPVFERMAARGREHCYVLLELIGKTGKSL